MNIKTKKLKLMRKGLSESTLSKLTDSEINLLFEQTQISIIGTELTPGMKTPSKSMTVVKQGDKLYGVPNESEMKEDLDEDEVDPMDFEKGQVTQQPHQVGPSSDDGWKNYDDGTGEFSEAKKKGKYNPWAICTTQMGKEFGTTKRSDWSKSDSRKYERCVNDVKKTIKEGKNPVSLFIEQKITQIVEKHLSPSITKGELLKYLSEAPTTAPAKPTTKPATKPGTRPSSPGKNPFPKEHPAPKANRPSPEIAKKKVIDLIKNIIEN